MPIIQKLAAARSILRFAARSQPSQLILKFPKPISRPFSLTSNRVIHIHSNPEAQQQLSWRLLWFVYRGRVVTGTIVAVCVGVFAVQWNFRREARQGVARARDKLEKYYKTMVLSLQNVREGRYYTMLTSSFTHMSGLHLLFNMMTLWSFGPIIILAAGLPAFCIVWLGSGVLGAYVQVKFWEADKNPHGIHQAVGSSAAILGLITLDACMFPTLTASLFMLPLPKWVLSAGFAAFSLACIREGWLPELGHAAHLGGMAFGATYWGLAAMYKTMSKGKGRLPPGLGSMPPRTTMMPPRSINPPPRKSITPAPKKGEMPPRRFS